MSKRKKTTLIEKIAIVMLAIYFAFATFVGSKVYFYMIDPPPYNPFDDRDRY